MTSWHRNEYLLKGVFLGLWVYFALQVPPEYDRALRDIGWVVGWAGAGLVLGIIAGTVLAFRRGLRPWQNWKSFPLVVLLESPTFIYGGIVAGLAVGVVSGAPDAASWAGPLAGHFGLTFEDIRHTGRIAPDPATGRTGYLLYFVLGGLVLGYGMFQLRQMEDAWRRFIFAGVVGIAGAYLITDYSATYLAEEALLRHSDQLRERLESKDADTKKAAAKQLRDAAGGLRELAGKPEKRNREQQAALEAVFTGRDEEMTKARDDFLGARGNYGLYLLLALPFFYLLVFVGDAEESPVEIAVFNALLGAGLYLVEPGGRESFLPSGTVAIVVPLALYFTYCTRVMPDLRVFKHALRGFAYMSVGRLRNAMYFFRRALELDPEFPPARTGMLQLHNSLSLPKLDQEPELAEVLDFNLCLDRAAGLLMQPPTAAELAEANRFLDLVETKKPALQARVDYLRAVALSHGKDYATAADVLSRLLNPETPYVQSVRKRVLFRAWVLAVKGPAGLTERVGWDELRKPGRKIEAIGAAERELAANPNEMAAKELKTVLYSQLSEPEFVAAAARGAPVDFDYAYVEQLGLALVDDVDPERRERGIGYLRVAGRGAPERGPGVFRKLALVSEHHGDRDAMRAYLETVKKCAAAVGGPGYLPRDQREIYSACLMRVADDAEAQGDAIRKEGDAARDRGDTATGAAKDAEARPHFEAAIDNIRLYLDGGGRNELEAYRKLADIYGKGRAVPNAVMNALLNTETGLTYSSTDADLLKKKDTYYYSVDPDQLAQFRDRVKGYFDVSYCIRKAMSVLNAKDGDAALVDWAAHLAKLARIMQPNSNGVRLVEARCMLRQGQRDEGIRVMESIRAGKKGSGEEEDAWYAATKILGQLYLEELNRPQDALRAFLDYKEYIKSGADTLYQIARCYEAQGDTGNAQRFYEAVTAYQEHPRAWDAQEALKRLRGG